MPITKKKNVNVTYNFCNRNFTQVLNSWIKGGNPWQALRAARWVVCYVCNKTSTLPTKRNVWDVYKDKNRVIQDQWRETFLTIKIFCSWPSWEYPTFPSLDGAKLVGQQSITLKCYFIRILHRMNKTLATN